MQGIPHTCRIGADGGGTRLRVALELAGTRHEVTRGAANATSDFDGTVAALTDALTEVAQQAGLTLDDITPCPAFLGLAGVTGPRLAARLAGALPLTNAEVDEDTRPAVAGALGDSDGAVIACGTGSFLARQHNGRLRFIGGHGLILGDEASAAWIGRTALARTLHALDGLIDHTALTEATLAHFPDGAEQLVAFAATATPAEFGAHAPRVVDAAQSGDATAHRIMLDGVHYVTHGLDVLGWHPGEPLVLMGGLGPAWHAFLPDPIAAAVVDPLGTALDGALLLAGRRA